MTQAISAYAIQLKRGANVVPELTNISDIGGTLNRVDVSAHDGTGWIERVATLLDGGQITAEFNFVAANAQHTGMRSDQTAKTLQSWSVVMPSSGPTWTFSAFVTDYRVGAPVDGAFPLSVQLTVSGAVTFA